MALVFFRNGQMKRRLHQEKFRAHSDTRGLSMERGDGQAGRAAGSSLVTIEAALSSYVCMFG